MDCGQYTHRIEVEQRRFNAGACVCGGPISPSRPSAKRTTLPSSHPCAPRSAAAQGTMLQYALICVIGASVHASLAAGYHHRLSNEDAPSRLSWELHDLRKIQLVCAAAWLGFSVIAVLIEVGR